MSVNVIEGYDLKRIQNLTGFSRQQIRTLVEKEFLTPQTIGNKQLFSYHDLSVIKSIKSLYDQGVSKSNIHRNFQLVRDRIDRRKPLSTASFRVIDGRLVFDDGQFLCSLTSNEYLLDLELGRGETEPPARRKTLEKVLSFGPQEAEVKSEPNWYAKAVQSEMNKDFDQAIEYYKKELENSPNSSDAMINLGRLYQVNRKDLIMAKACYESVLLQEPDDELANFNLGTVWYSLENPQKALECYKKAVNIPDAYFERGRILEELGNGEEADEQYAIYEQLLEEIGSWDDDFDDDE